MKVCVRCNKEKELTEFSKDKTRPDGLFPYCCECKKLTRNKERDRKTSKIYRKNKPWCRVLESIKQRCYNPKCERYKNYGGRGIKCYLTQKNIKFLWDRDNAFLLKKPSIDRIDNDGDYTLENCRFMEYKENSIKNKLRPINQYDLNGTFIKSWNSITEVTGNLHIYNISRAIKYNLTAGGYKWLYQI